MRIVTPLTTDDRDEFLRGRVDAARINDCRADPKTERYQNYLSYVQERFRGEPVVYATDEHRYDDERLRLVERALDAYCLRHPDVELQTGRVYLMDDFPIACCPDAVDAGVILTVRTHRSLRTYRQTLAAPLTPDERRKAWAMTAAAGLCGFVYLDYYEDAETGVRKLGKPEREVDLCLGRAEQLLGELITFASRTRFKAQQAATA